MFWTQLNRVAGALMLLLVLGLILGFLFAQTPDAARDEIAADLVDLNEDEELFIFGQAVQIAVALLVTALGAALYAVFHVRDRFLALLGFAGFLGLGILFAVSSALYVALQKLASDFVDGGAGGAGEPEILEIARAVTLIGDGAFFVGIWFFALGLIGFGTLIATAPQRVVVSPSAAAVVSPPTWMGWVAVAAGVCYFLGVLFLVTEILFIFTGIAFLLTMVWYIGLGYWMLFRAPALVEEVAESPSAL